MIKFEFPFKTTTKKIFDHIDDYFGAYAFTVTILAILLIDGKSRFQAETLPKLKASVNSDFKNYLDSYKIEYKVSNCYYDDASSNFKCNYSTEHSIQRIVCDYSENNISAFYCETPQ
jgi:hypothetical protein